jgi:predicted DNA-binding protein with PD1-like motif
MRTKLLHERDGLRTFAVVFSHGDEVAAGLREFAREHQLTAASLTAIGALSDITWGYFDWDRKDYIRASRREQLEVLTMTGNIAVKDGEPQIHAHVVLGRADGTAVGGHLLEAHVRPTLEVVAVETPSYLRRRVDDETGLALIDLET